MQPPVLARLILGNGQPSHRRTSPVPLHHLVEATLDYSWSTVLLLRTIPPELVPRITVGVNTVQAYWHTPCRSPDIRTVAPWRSCWRCVDSFPSGFFQHGVPGQRLVRAHCRDFEARVAELLHTDTAWCAMCGAMMLLVNLPPMGEREFSEDGICWCCSDDDDDDDRDDCNA